VPRLTARRSAVAAISFGRLPGSIRTGSTLRKELPDEQADRVRVRESERRHGGAGRRADPPSHRLDVRVHLREDHYAYKLEELDEAESLLLGRVTFEGFAAAWPEREGPFAEKINSMPKYVVSSTLTDPEWENTTVLSGDPIEEVTKLRDADGGPILVNGSAQLVYALCEAGLVDEYRAMVHPVLVADGLRMFPDPPRC
jgi:dihydrofolate reductase